MQILGPAAIVGVVGIVAVGLTRNPLEEWTRRSFGDSAAELVPILLILPSFFFFFPPMMWAERRAKAYSLSCPACNANLSQRMHHRVLVTKCCSVCGVQVVDGGQVRSREVFDRCAPTQVSALGNLLKMQDARCIRRLLKEITGIFLNDYPDEQYTNGLNDGTNRPVEDNKFGTRVRNPSWWYAGASRLSTCGPRRLL